MDQLDQSRHFDPRTRQLDQSVDQMWSTRCLSKPYRPIGVCGGPRRFFILVIEHTRDSVLVNALGIASDVALGFEQTQRQSFSKDRA